MNRFRGADDSKNESNSNRQSSPSFKPANIRIAQKSVPNESYPESKDSSSNTSIIPSKHSTKSSKKEWQLPSKQGIKYSKLEEDKAEEAYSRRKERILNSLKVSPGSARKGAGINLTGRSSRRTKNSPNKGNKIQIVKISQGDMKGETTPKSCMTCINNCTPVKHEESYELSFPRSSSQNIGDIEGNSMNKRRTSREKGMRKWVEGNHSYRIERGSEYKGIDKTEKNINGINRDINRDINTYTNRDTTNTTKRNKEYISINPNNSGINRISQTVPLTPRYTKATETETLIKKELELINGQIQRRQGPPLNSTHSHIGVGANYTQRELLLPTQTQNKATNTTPLTILGDTILPPQNTYFSLSKKKEKGGIVSSHRIGRNNGKRKVTRSTPREFGVSRELPITPKHLSPFEPIAVPDTTRIQFLYDKYQYKGDSLIRNDPGEFYDRNINWLKNKEQNLSQIKNEISNKEEQNNSFNPRINTKPILDRGRFNFEEFYASGKKWKQLTQFNNQERMKAMFPSPMDTNIHKTPQKSKIKPKIRGAQTQSAKINKNMTDSDSTRSRSYLDQNGTKIKGLNPSSSLNILNVDTKNKYINDSVNTKYETEIYDFGTIMRQLKHQFRDLKTDNKNMLTSYTNNCPKGKIISRGEILNNNRLVRLRGERARNKCIALSTQYKTYNTLHHSLNTHTSTEQIPNSKIEWRVRNGEESGADILRREIISNNENTQKQRKRNEYRNNVDSLPTRVKRTTREDNTYNGTKSNKLLKTPEEERSRYEGDREGRLGEENLNVQYEELRRDIMDMKVKFEQVKQENVGLENEVLDLQQVKNRDLLTKYMQLTP